MVTPALRNESSPANGDQPGFDTVMRGYDRRQVEEHIQLLSSELREVRHARQQAEQRAVQAEDELRSALTKLKQQTRKLDERASEPSQEGFGYRVEKVLRMAEQEASEIRSKAAREAAILVEKARAEAETHRHDVEQSLIARAATMDQEAAQRQVDLQEREQQLADQMASARAEIEQTLAAAERDAYQLRQDAEIRAQQVRERAEQLARQHRDAADQELRRLTGLQNGVRGELARLHTLLAGELGERGDGEA